MSQLETLLQKAQIEEAKAEEEIRREMQEKIDAAKKAARDKVLATGLPKQQENLTARVQAVSNRVFADANPREVRSYVKALDTVLGRYDGSVAKETFSPLGQREPRYTAADVKLVAKYIRKEVDPGARIVVNDLYNSMKSSGDKVARDTLYDILKGPLDEQGLVVQNGNRGKYTRKFKVSAEALVPHVKQAFKEHGYVSSAMLAKQGLGTKANLRSLGKAISHAIPLSTKREVESFQVTSSELGSSYKIFHLAGKEPTEYIE